MQDIHQKLDELKVEVSNMNNMLKGRKELSYTNILIWGKILINHIQQLRSYNEQLFDKWFQKYRLEIFGKPEDEAKRRNLPDKILDYFIEERNKLEHEEVPKFQSIMEIKHLNLPRDLGPRPINATGIFVDGFGVGWHVRTSEGTIEKLYVRLSEDFVKLSLKPTNLQTIGSKSLMEMMEYYVDYLTRMVEDAINVFS